MSKSRLFSGKIKKATGAHLDPNRGKYLDLSNAEPDLGLPDQDQSILVSDNLGTRTWTPLTDIAITNIVAGNDITITTGTGTVTVDFINNTGYITTSAFLEVSSDILPSQNLMYNLGSQEKQWASLYVGTATIHVANNTISVNEYGVLTVNGTATVSVINVRGNGLSTEFDPLTGVATISSTGVTDLNSENGITISDNTGSITIGFNTSTLVSIATTLIEDANVILGDVTVDGAAIFNGYVVFNNTTTYNITTNTVYTDNLLELHAPPDGVDASWEFNDGKDIGIRFHYYEDGDQNAGFVFSHDERKFEFYATGYESSGTFVGTYGVIKANSLDLVDGIGNSYINFPDGSQQTTAWLGTDTLMSNAVNALSADYATTSSYASTSSYAVNAGYASTSSYASTAGSIEGRYVTSIVAGTDTAISTSTGDVTIWDISTFQSVTNRGNITTNQIIIDNATETTSTTTGGLIVTGGVGIGGGLNVGGTITATNLILGELAIDFGSVFNGFDSTDDVNIIGGNLNVSSATVITTASVATFIGYIYNRNLYVTSVTTGTIYKGMVLYGPAIDTTGPNSIYRQKSGTIGGIGTYELKTDYKKTTTTSTFTGILTATSAIVYAGGGITAYYITASIITGNLTGNVTGNVTGNLTGNVTGDVKGNVTGNVSGTASGLSGNQKANTFYAGPASGKDNIGVWRPIVVADIPTLNQDTTGLAGNISGGDVNRILYQSTKDNTSFITAPNSSNTYLGWNGTVFSWSIPVGFIGSRGFFGSQGFTGSASTQIGFTGSRGFFGSQGDTGYVGSASTQIGYTGSFGYTGSKGDLGFIGSRGFFGSQGTGFTGSKGDLGSLGYTGSRGDTGYVGSASTQIGYTGSRGDTGYVGSASTQIGYTGSFGITGFTGSIGYTGSRGDTGYVGSASTQIGYNGSVGFTGSASTQIGFTGSRGFFGSQGFTGSKGDLGSLGYTGSQGDTGYVGSASTQIGYNGSVGYAGSRGDTGSIGPQGPQGPVGIFGYTGSFGATGYTGSNGAFAAVGYTGSTGTGANDSADTYLFAPAGTVVYTATNSVRVFKHGVAPTNNWTPNITGLGLTNNQATVVKVVAPPSAVADYNILPPLIDGTTTNITSFGFNLKASKNKTNFFTLDIIKDNTGTYAIFGNVTSF